ncbi:MULTISPECIES: aminoglycoside adenylyltransferase domain-containing protein [Corynebacterium]|jgi:hypothetical protein|uniref:aminoglycoside adenylyltransferase domain-containing protein n=1 Tax=Corynebacterium TaxID=1716 RepID=UPI00211BF86D|nr:aminoglycoside adenylyltransferase domain-containing protein [Corynebacterium phoceense]MCQ9342088.1 DUF4111 domain-containing protein [Corynebacterium phoceense]
MEFYDTDLAAIQQRIVDHLLTHDPGKVLGAYLYGSAASSGLRSRSDIDILVLTQSSLNRTERQALIALLLGISGWIGHAETFPEATSERPIELTTLAVGESWTITEAPVIDFQYGEWLRESMWRGNLPQPTVDPDALTLVATAQSANVRLLGAPLGDLIPPIPSALLHHAVKAVIPDLMEEIIGDEMNSLLTLARILVTLDTGQIVSKDAAADMIAPTLNDADRALMELARDVYLGNAPDSWTGYEEGVLDLTQLLAERT